MNDYFKQRIVDGEENPEYDTEAMPAPANDPHPVFIAFSGKKQCGKDTAAEMAALMLEGAGKDVVTTAFAATLKGMCIAVLGLDKDLVYGSDDDKNKPTHIMWDGFSDEIRNKYAVAWYPSCAGKRPVHRVGPMSVREVLQIMGTDVFRAIYDDVWANAPFNKDWIGYDAVILTDCRFPNEKRVTEERGGVIIRLERYTGHKDDHSSETALDDEHFDILYHNNGSLEELEEFVRMTLANKGLI